MPYGEKFERALVYASRLHKDQYRKGTRIPYVTYLLAVADSLSEVTPWDAAGWSDHRGCEVEVQYL